MNRIDRCTRQPTRQRGWTTLLLGIVLAGCGSGGSGDANQGRDPILGGGGSAMLRPTVTAVAPVNNATGVPIDNTLITAEFSEPMRPISGGASFTVTCTAPCVSPGGSVTLNTSNRIATFTLTTGTRLSPLTIYTGTITGASSIATGLSLAQPFIWHFTTGITPDTTRPRVIITQPITTIPGPTLAVATNTAITAVFSEDMAPATINASSFTLVCAAPCIAPTGTVSYVVGSRTATFLPNAVLVDSAAYTATISSATTDLADNQLGGNQAALPAASDYVWTFTTAAALPPPPAPINVTVTSSNPAAGANDVCPTDAINATFQVGNGLRMGPNTISTATFLVTGPAPALTPVPAISVALDNNTGLIATYTPTDPLTASVTYTATIKGGATGVKDTAIPGNIMASDFVWTFSVVSCITPPPPPPPASFPLGAASTFGAYGGSAGMTSQGLLTIVNGDIGTTAVSTAVTGFHDANPGCTYTETPLNNGTVNGLIYTAPPPPTVGCPTEGTAETFAIASAARLAALTAYNTLAGLPPGSDPGAGNLANKTLAPGTYTANAGSFMIQGGDLTLDGQGDANAVWVFQMATSLTVGGPGAAFPQSVRLINGAQAKNVFWQVGSAATINAAGGGTFMGTVISQSGVAVSTADNVTIVTVNGRLLSLGASVTVVNTVINVPSP